MAAVFAMLFFVLLIVAGVMLLVFSTIRFYKNIVRDEGYLMHTLPVPTWQLIASKFISVYIWFFVMIIVTGICSGIAFGEPFWLFKFIGEFKEVVPEIREAMGEDVYPIFIGMLKYYAIFMVLSPFLAMANVYFAFALGNLFNKSKLGMSVVMFFSAQFAESIISSIISSILFSSDMLAFAVSLNEEAPPTQVMEYLNNVTSFSIVFSLIFAIGYTITAERIFAKKLNLE